MALYGHGYLVGNCLQMGLSWLNDGQSWSIMAYIYIELLVGGDWNHGIWSDFP
jgi:hypothetical protein